MKSIKANKKNVTLSFLISVILCCLFICLNSIPVYAAPEDTEKTGNSMYGKNNDNINEYEYIVLEQASKTMKYEGRIYYAYGEYMDELVSYLSREDTDLKEKDANDAIKQLKDESNVKAGAQSGYLYQVGGKPESTGTGDYDGELYPEFKKSERFQNEAEYRESDLYKNNKAYIATTTNVVYESQRAMRKEMRDLAQKDREYKRIIKQKPENAYIKSFEINKNIGIAFLVISILILLLVIGIIIFNYKNGTISLLLTADDEQWNRKNSHRTRHKIRLVSSVALIVIVAIDLAIVYSGLTYHNTVGADNFVEKAMDESGVCQHGFMGFRNDIHSFLNDKKLPQNTLDLVLTYRDYRFDYVKGVRSAMNDGDKEAMYRGVHDTVKAQIDLMAYITKQDSKSVVKGVEKIYDDSLSNEVGLFVYSMRKGIKKNFMIGYILSILSLLLAALMLVVERHFIYTGIKDLAIGALAGTGVWGLITAWLKFGFDVKTVPFSSDSVYATAVAGSSDMSGFMLILLGVSAVISILMFVLTTIVLKKAN